MAKWLEAKTGKGDAYWMARIQSLILDHSIPSEKYPDHFVTKTVDVLRELADEIMQCAPPDDPPYDENMYAFSVMAQIATLWYSRVHLAKISDPRRPVDIAMQRYNEVYVPWYLAMCQVMFDQSHDPEYFAGQEWQQPFSPDAKNGNFV